MLSFPVPLPVIVSGTAIRHNTDRKDRKKEKKKEIHVLTKET